MYGVSSGLQNRQLDLEVLEVEPLGFQSLLTGVCDLLTDFEQYADPLELQAVTRLMLANQDADWRSKRVSLDILPRIRELLYEMEEWKEYAPVPYCVPVRRKEEEALYRKQTAPQTPPVSAIGTTTSTSA